MECNKKGGLPCKFLKASEGLFSNMEKPKVPELKHSLPQIRSSRVSRVFK